MDSPDTLGISLGRKKYINFWTVRDNRAVDAEDIIWLKGLIREATYVHHHFQKTIPTLYSESIMIKVFERIEIIWIEVKGQPSIDYFCSRIKLRTKESTCHWDTRRVIPEMRVIVDEFRYGGFVGTWEFCPFLFTGCSGIQGV